jgi:hypothetical protein
MSANASAIESSLCSSIMMAWAAGSSAITCCSSSADLSVCQKLSLRDAARNAWHTCGSNHEPLRRLTSARGTLAANGVEYVDHLGEQCNAGMHGNRRAAQPLRTALTVPVFVQAENACGHGLAKTEPPDDSGAALAAGVDQLGGQRLTVTIEVQQPFDPLAQRFAGTGMPQDEGGELRKALRIHELEITLGAQFIATVEFTQAGRIAAAPCILQKYV